MNVAGSCHALAAPRRRPCSLGLDVGVEGAERVGGREGVACALGGVANGGAVAAAGDCGHEVFCGGAVAHVVCVGETGFGVEVFVLTDSIRNDGHDVSTERRA